MKVSVLLLKPVKWLWNSGEIHNVAASYAINVLYKQGLAKAADKAVLDNKKSHEAAQQRHSAQEQEKFEKAIEAITSQGALILEKQATETGKLFEGIDSKKVAHHLQTQFGFSIDAKWVKLDPAKIDHTGTYTATLTMGKLSKKISIEITKK
jgi:large subunit ribosomal protein L9